MVGNGRGLGRDGLGNAGELVVSSARPLGSSATAVAWLAARIDIKGSRVVAMVILSGDAAAICAGDRPVKLWENAERNCLGHRPMAKGRPVVVRMLGLEPVGVISPPRLDGTLGALHPFADADDAAFVALVPIMIEVFRPALDVLVTTARFNNPGHFRVTNKASERIPVSARAPLQLKPAVIAPAFHAAFLLGFEVFDA